MKKIIILTICLLCLACDKTSSKSSPSSELENLMSNNEYIIVDVRTKEEYQTSHLKDALNIPYDTIDSNTKLDKDKLILVYCKSGNRSRIAMKTLTDLGYNVYDLGAFDSIPLEKE